MSEWMNAEEEYLELLTVWCNRLITLQCTDEQTPRTYGGIICPSCLMIHGRCHDAVYPMMMLADRLKDDTYLQAARLLFQWSSNLLCDDGSYYNDAQNDWAGTTVFSAIALCHALEKHGLLLEFEERKRWEERLFFNIRWVYEKIVVSNPCNINYHAAAAEALALAGHYFHMPAYLERAEELVHFCVCHISPEGLLYGEGKPREAYSPKGCRAVDIGYNVEESLASLLACGRLLKDEAVIQEVKRSLLAHLDFMNPDGGWDNSMGTRNYKWSYWGSRTSDGCQIAYGLWDAEEPVFLEAAYRNVKLYQACTHDGLLYGGPHYYEHGEQPCVHHTFCKAKALALVLDEGGVFWERVQLPSEYSKSLKFWPVLHTYKAGTGPYLATFSAYDIEYQKGGHASGGCMSMLWHQKAGVLFASSTTEYGLVEVTNSQLSLKKSCHRPMTMRVESRGELYRSNQYDKTAVFRRAEVYQNCIMIETEASLEDRDHQEQKRGACIISSYEIKPEEVHCTVRMLSHEEKAVWVIPVVSLHQYPCVTDDNHIYRIAQKDFMISISFTHPPKSVTPVFFLNGGFEGQEFELELEEGIEYGFTLSVEDTKIQFL